ncbi:MAG: NADH-ubiquinone oxidoreductase-F iron-sulfur binding region domain-containing protein [Coriobacteriales bacterium]
MSLEYQEIRSREIVESFPKEHAQALPMLQALQAEFGYVPEESIEDISMYLDYPSAQLYAMASFYHSLSVEEGAALRVKPKPPLPLELISGNGADELQHPVAFAGYGEIDPESIESYRAHGGYQGLERALELDSLEIIRILEKSELRGKGGAGFPTGRKWRSAFEQAAQPKYVVCNADEGEPACYVDEALLEGNPHAVLEGLIIASLAIGAHDAYIYLRSDYELARARIEHAIDEARGAGIISEHILGSEHAIDVHVFSSGGNYICGESSALMKSMEGSMPEPRTDHVHCTEHGLFDKPTVLNNVETLAVVGRILAEGPEKFASEDLTKAFTVTGPLKRTGIVEVPLGTTLRTVIFDICGGMKDGHTFKAVLPGGACESVISEQLLDTPIDFETMRQAGIQMGSGALRVIDERRCIVETVLEGVHFSEYQSCGRCTPCREGLRQIEHILSRICTGKGRPEDLELLEGLGQTMSDAAICALGQTAALPVTTALDQFRDEFETHINEKRCPAGACACGEGEGA